MLSSAGFEDTRYYLVSAGIAKVSIEDYLEKTRKKFISTLTLLSEEEFRKGFRIFEKKLREKGGNEVVYEKNTRLSLEKDTRRYSKLAQNLHEDS